MNTIIIEMLVLGLIFTFMVYKMSRNPLKELYNYPPKIQERVKSLKQYNGKIPTTRKNISKNNCLHYNNCRNKLYYEVYKWI